MNSDIKGLFRNHQGRYFDDKFITEEACLQLLGVAFDEKTLLDEFSDDEMVSYFDAQYKQRRSERRWQAGGVVATLLLPGLGLSQAVSGQSFAKRQHYVEQRNKRISANIMAAKSMLHDFSSQEVCDELRMLLDDLQETKYEHNRIKRESADANKNLRRQTAVGKLASNFLGGPIASAVVSGASLGRQIQLQARELRARRRVDQDLKDRKIQSKDLFLKLKTSYNRPDLSSEDKVKILRVASQLFGLSTSKMSHLFKDSGLLDQGILKLHLNHDKGSLADGYTQFIKDKQAFESHLKSLLSRIEYRMG